MIKATYLSVNIDNRYQIKEIVIMTMIWHKMCHKMCQLRFNLLFFIVTIKRFANNDFQVCILFFFLT